MGKASYLGENAQLLLEETSAYEIIERDAETVCFKIYHDKTKPQHVREAAKLKVIQANLRFALKFAMDYSKITKLPLEDFYTDAKLGLMEAFYKFDWNKNVKFISYAVWYMRTRMGTSVQENDLVRVPVRLRKKVLNAIKKGLPIDDIKYGAEANASISHTFSMDAPMDQADNDDCPDITVGDSIPESSSDLAPDYNHARELLTDKIESEMKHVLTLEESALLRRLYGLDGGEESSLEEAAADFCSSKDWARRTKAKAIAKLRNSHGLDDFAKGV